MERAIRSDLGEIPDRTVPVIVVGGRKQSPMSPVSDPLGRQVNIRGGRNHNAGRRERSGGRRHRERHRGTGHRGATEGTVGDDHAVVMAARNARRGVQEVVRAAGNIRIVAAVVAHLPLEDVRARAGGGDARGIGLDGEGAAGRNRTAATELGGGTLNGSDSAEDSDAAISAILFPPRPSAHNPPSASDRPNRRQTLR